MPPFEGLAVVRNLCDNHAISEVSPRAGSPPPCFLTTANPPTVNQLYDVYDQMASNLTLNRHTLYALLTSRQLRRSQKRIGRRARLHLVAGYSGVSLAAKLGIKTGTTVVWLDGPDDLDPEMPPGVTISREDVRSADVVVAFFTEASVLETRIETLASIVFPAGSVWIAWPKKASRVDTDLSDNAVRAQALRRGLVDNKVCAVDATWSALRVVWRKELRNIAARSSKQRK